MVLSYAGGVMNVKTVREGKYRIVVSWDTSKTASFTAFDGNKVVLTGTFNCSSLDTAASQAKALVRNAC